MDRRAFIGALAGVTAGLVLAAAAASTAQALPLLPKAGLPATPDAPAGGGRTPDGTEIEQAYYRRRYYHHRYHRPRRYWYYHRRRRYGYYHRHRRYGYYHRRRRYW